MKRRGCVTNLLEARDILTEAIHLGFCADIVFTDFAKAFDRVSHRLLLYKLKHYGIRGRLLSWIEAWLKGRRQRVVIGKHYSDWKEVTSGVPQGSVLGPLLFLIFINDLPDAIASHIKLYVDDSKIIRIIKSEQDTIDLQEDIDAAAEWSQNWLIPFNIEKCKVMHIGRPGNRSNNFYTMPDTNGIRRLLDVTAKERDLGVLVSNDLKVRIQVESAASVANRVLGRLKKTFRSRGLALWRALYLAYVRPHLEFAVQAWSPHLKRDIGIIERVQHRATKVITSLKHMPYTMRLRELELTTLEERRVRGDLIEQFKIFHGLDEVHFFVPQKAPSWQTQRVYNLRGHNCRLESQHVKNCLERSEFFTNRVVGPWNALPQEAINASSVNMFKDLLRV